ncbi:hypothetical protein Hanom_Chr11g00989461 [Helianthus anomalus]
MRKNKPLDESRKTGQTSGTKNVFFFFLNLYFHYDNNNPDRWLTSPRLTLFPFSYNFNRPY